MAPAGQNRNPYEAPRRTPYVSLAQKAEEVLALARRLARDGWGSFGASDLCVLLKRPWCGTPGRGPQPNRVVPVLQHLADRGLLERLPKGEAGRQYRYRLPGIEAEAETETRTPEE